MGGDLDVMRGHDDCPFPEAEKGMQVPRKEFIGMWKDPRIFDICSVLNVLDS